MPKTASVFSLLTVRAPAGLHLVTALQQETAGAHSSPEYSICPCFHFFFSWYVYRLNALIYLYQTVISCYLFFLMVSFGLLWPLMNCSAVLLGCFWSWASSVFMMQGLETPTLHFSQKTPKQTPNIKTKPPQKHLAFSMYAMHIMYYHVLQCKKKLFESTGIF